MVAKSLTIQNLNLSIISKSLKAFLHRVKIIVLKIASKTTTVTVFKNTGDSQIK